MQEELHPDIEGLAPMEANPSAPEALAPAAKAIGGAIAPNLTSLATGEAPSPIGALPEYGKVPSAQDPRINQAIGEFGELGAAVLPLVTMGTPMSLGTHIISKLTRASDAALGIAAGATGMTVASQEAEAAPRLSRQQKQDLEFQAQALQQKVDIEKQAAKDIKLDELDARRAGDDYTAELKRKEADAAETRAINHEKEIANLARAEEARKANLPLRQKYPELTMAMNGAGLALTALIPFGVKSGQAAQGLSKGFVRTWNGVATEAEAALKNKEMDTARILIDQLVGFKKEALVLEAKSSSGASQLKRGIGNAAAVASPIETQMLPEQLDLANGSEEAKSKAIANMLDPVRLPASLLQGVLGTSLGNKLPPLFQGNPAVARAKTAGLESSLNTGLLRSLERETSEAAAKQATAVKRAATLAAKKKVIK